LAKKTQQKHGILAKSRHSGHLTKIMVSVISVIIYCPYEYQKNLDSEKCPSAE